MADDFGRLLDSPKQIEAFVWPYADCSRECSEGLATLSRMGRVVRGTTASGQAVIQIANWSKHQRVDKPSTKTALPEIVAGLVDTGHSRKARATDAEDSRESRESPGAFGEDHARLSRSDLGPRTTDQEQEQEVEQENDSGRQAADNRPLSPGINNDELTTAQRIVIAANKATAEKFGEQIRPLLPGHAKTVELAADLETKRIPIDFAERSIVRQIGQLAGPVRTVAYFRAGILEDWESRQANAAAAAAPRVLPLDRTARNETRPPLGGPSPPVPNDGKICRACGATETTVVNGRIVPKHLEGCFLAVATTQIGAGGKRAESNGTALREHG